MPNRLDLARLRNILSAANEIGDAPVDLSIIDVTGDSRTIVPGSLFVAIAGAAYDGHRAIPDAIERGAVAVVGTASRQDLAGLGIVLTVPYLQVSDSRVALARCSAALYDYPSQAVPVIGITGTDGKTSTLTILESILQAATRDERAPLGRVGLVTTVGARIMGQAHDTGFHVTTPDAPLVQRFLADMRDAGCHYAVIESTSHGLAQGRVAAVDFDVAAVTNITHEHLDYHGSWDAYAAAKAVLFRSLFHTAEKEGIPKVAVLNADDDASFRFLQTALAEEQAQSKRDVRIRSYGIRETDSSSGGPIVDVSAVNVAYQPDRTTFTVQHASGAFDVETSLIGSFNVQNILCASTVAFELGISVEAIRQGIRSLSGIIGRMERIDRGQSFLAVVDFAHSPASLTRALATLRTVAQHNGSDGRIIAVFGSAGLRDKEKRRLMGQVSGRLADFTVITAEDPRTENLHEINRAIEAGLLTEADSSAYAIVPDRAEAIQFAVDMAEPGDVVVAFGKGHERSMCFGETEFPWSDQDALASALVNRLDNPEGRKSGSHS